MSDDLKTRQVRAEEARQFMSNPLFAQAFGGVKAGLDMEMLACNPDDHAKCQRIIISRQLLEAVRREVERVAEDGDFAAFQMQQANAQSNRGLRLFQR